MSCCHIFSPSTLWSVDVHVVFGMFLNSEIYRLLVHLSNTQQILLKCIAVLVIASASSAWILIPAVLMVIIFMSLRWYYLQTSRQVKRLEAIGQCINSSLRICAGTTD